MFLNFLFLLILFPLSLLVYHCVPQRWQQPVLLGTSILFLVLWQAECSLLFFGLIFLTGLFSRLLAHLSPRTLPARLLLLFHDAISFSDRRMKDTCSGWHSIRSAFRF